MRTPEKVQRQVQLLLEGGWVPAGVVGKSTTLALHQQESAGLLFLPKISLGREYFGFPAYLYISAQHAFSLFDN